MASAAKTSWADDVDDIETNGVFAQDSVDENGIRTTVEYTTNDEGKRVKITRRSRRVLQKSIVEHAVAERKQWSKFGKERGNKPGPDRATTTVGENVSLKLTVGNKAAEQEPTQEQVIKANLAKAGGGKVTCRLCKGDHFTAKCPYKDSLAGLDASENVDSDGALPPPEAPAPGALGSSASIAAAGSGGSGSKYVPPSMRAGGITSAGSNPRASANDLPTLRVTNISEDTQEQDLRDLFSSFGRVARVYVGRDRETGAGKGFAFVSFEDKDAAKKAIEKVNGRGYDNLILSVGWSQPREAR